NRREVHRQLMHRRQLMRPKRRGLQLLDALLKPPHMGGFVPAFFAHFLFHGLKSSRYLGSYFDQSPSNVMARSSMVRKAAGFSVANLTSSSPGPAGLSYQVDPLWSYSQAFIAAMPPFWLLLELKITTSKCSNAPSMNAIAPSTGGSGITSAP